MNVTAHMPSPVRPPVAGENIDQAKHSAQETLKVGVGKKKSSQYHERCVACMSNIRQHEWQLQQQAQPLLLTYYYGVLHRLSMLQEAKHRADEATRPGETRQRCELMLGWLRSVPCDCLLTATGSCFQEHVAAELEHHAFYK